MANNKMKQELLLEGLNCANCALKIENEVNSIAGVQVANLDFASTKLRIKNEAGQNPEKTLAMVQAIVSRIEPDVRVVAVNNRSEVTVDSRVKKKVLQFGVALILFIVALVANLPLEIELLLYGVSYIIVGYEIVFRALRNILRGEIFDENFLMSVATIGAFIIGEYAEGVAVMLFYQVGEILQGLAVNRSRQSISSLMDIRPDRANLLVEEKIKTVNPEMVEVGNLIVVKPGEKIPLDGIVVEGFSMVDTKALTGNRFRVCLVWAILP